MRILKKTLAAVLCAALTVSLLAGLGLHAGAAGTCTRAELEKLIADTAIAYYLKGPDCQYDSFVLAGHTKSKTAIQRLTFGVSPEEASPQRRFYTVCSSFPHEVYYDVMRSHVLNPEDMAGTERSDFSRVEEYTGLQTGTLTREDMLYPLSLLSLTAAYGAYGKKVARIGDSETFEQGWIGHDGIAFFWGGNSYEDITDEQVAELWDNLRPGDIISAVRGAEDDEDGENSGHTMMYLGDYMGDGNRYIIHSGGYKYNYNDTSFSGSTTGALRPGLWTDTGTADGDPIIGFDCVENASADTRNGTIHISRLENYLGRGKSYGPDSKGYSVVKQFVITRPIDRLIGWHGTAAEVSDDDLFPKDALTSNALARMQYPGLEVTTVASKNTYQSVQAGEEITYSWIVENDTNLASMGSRYRADDGTNGRSYSGMRLTLPLPANASYVEHSIVNTATTGVSGTTSYDGQTHCLTVDGFMSRRGSVFRVDVTVRVSPDAQLGDKIVLPRGGLTGTKTESRFSLAGMTHTVGGAQPTGFDTITSGSVVPSGARSKMDVAADVYAAAGYRLELPGTRKFLNSVLTYTFQPRASTRRMMSRLLEEREITDPDALLLRKMIVPEYYGGKKLFTPNEAGVKTNGNRLRDFSEDFLQPGDVLVYAYTGASSEVTGRGFGSEPDAEQVYVYLGNSDYACYDNEGAFRVLHAPLRTFMYSGSTPKGELTDFDRNGNTPAPFSRVEWSAVLTQAFRFSYFFCLRPSLAYQNLPTMTPSVSAAYTVENGGVTTGYASLAAAVAAANASPGSILTLHEDAALTENQTFYSGTLDLGGHTLRAGDFTLSLGSGSAVQTLRGGTVTGNGNPVFCAGTGSTEICGAKIYGGSAGAALKVADTATVTLESAELASAAAGEYPLRTVSGGTAANVTFRNDVTLLIPSAYADAFDGNGAVLGANVTCDKAVRNGYYKIANAESEATYRPFFYTKDPAVLNETTGTSYATLGKAIELASEDDALRLLRDVRVSDLREIGSSGSYGRAVESSNSGARYAFRIGKRITIDFDGHAVYGDCRTGQGSTAFQVGGVTTMKNGTIHGQGTWAVNQTGLELHLDNMKLYAGNVAVLISDSGKIDRKLYVENGSLVVGGLGGNTTDTSNSAVELRHGRIIVRGGGRIGSLTGIAIRPNALNGTAEKPNTSNVTVEDGGLFTGRYAYVHNDSELGYYDTNYDHAKNLSTLTFLADSDAQYLRQEHQEETIELPGSTAVVAVDRALKLEEAILDEPDLKTAYSLNLNDKIVINYYAEDRESACTDGSYALADGAKIPMEREDGSWYLAVRESAAKEMGKESTVQAFCRDGAGVFRRGRASTLSIRGYAETILAATDWGKPEEATLGRAMIAMLDYGAEAQKYFGYETGDLADKNLTGADRERMTFTSADVGKYRTDKRTVNDPEGVYAASSCVLGSSQALRFYLNLPESRTDREGLVFRVNYRSYRGEKQTLTRFFAELTETEADGVYYLEVPDLRAADILTDVVLTVEQNGSAIASVTDSVASYCARVQLEQPETASLADALLVYGLSAQEHFRVPAPVAGENELPVN